MQQALLPFPARNEWREDPGETNKNAPPLPNPLLYPMEEDGEIEELDAALARCPHIQNILEAYDLASTESINRCRRCDAGV
jgi:hypothetical protein